jgi:hypothetical protein
MKTQTCTGCKKTKSITEFAWRKMNVTRRARCKECIKLESNNYYATNENRRRSISSDRKRNLEKTQEKLFEFLRSHPCEACGENRLVCLQLHHLDPTKKDANVSEMLRKGRSWDSLMKEIAKCVVLCANCHAVETASLGGWRKYSLPLSYR